MLGQPGDTALFIPQAHATFGLRISFEPCPEIGRLLSGEGKDFHPERHFLLASGWLFESSLAARFRASLWPRRKGLMAARRIWAMIVPERDQTTRRNYVSRANNA